MCASRKQVMRPNMKPQPCGGPAQSLDTDAGDTRNAHHASHCFGCPSGEGTDQGLGERRRDS